MNNNNLFLDKKYLLHCQDENRNSPTGCQTSFVLRIYWYIKTIHLTVIYLLKMLVTQRRHAWFKGEKKWPPNFYLMDFQFFYTFAYILLAMFTFTQIIVNFGAFHTTITHHKSSLSVTRRLEMLEIYYTVRWSFESNYCNFSNNCTCAHQTLIPVFLRTPFFLFNRLRLIQEHFSH